MKKISLQGYYIALAFINMYEQDDSMGLNELLPEHKKIQFELSKMVTMWNRKGHDMNKELDVAWKKFESLVGTEYAVSSLPFAFHLILKNPTINKYGRLKKMALEASKFFRFKKEQEVVQSKNLVNRFYEIGEYK